MRHLSRNLSCLAVVVFGLAMTGAVSWVRAESRGSAIQSTVIYGSTLAIRIQNFGSGPFKVSLNGLSASSISYNPARQIVTATFSDLPTVPGTYLLNLSTTTGILSASADITIGLRDVAELTGSTGSSASTASLGNSMPLDVIPILGMVWISPGTFIQGSPGGDLDILPPEKPQTVVTLTRGFWMGVHEVTQYEYETVAGTNPSSFKSGPQFPVEQVSWDEAMAYCAHLTIIEREAGHLPIGWAYTLPTEAQWEYVCRSGPRTARLSYGDDLTYDALGNYAWYDENSNGTTHPVEQRLASPWGIQDLHGNVLEWCRDWYGPYPGGSVTDPTGPGPSGQRVARGGSWTNPARDCRCAYRCYFRPADRLSNVGFRVILIAGQP